MQLLLDTNAYLWLAATRSRLSSRARVLLGGNHELFLSIVSLWEIVIKVTLRRLELDLPLETLLDDYHARYGIVLQGITVDALGVLATLPWYHRDPFDRLLIAQAIDAHVAIVSADTAFDAYP